MSGMGIDHDGTPIPGLFIPPRPIISWYFPPTTEGSSGGLLLLLHHFMYLRGKILCSLSDHIWNDIKKEYFVKLRTALSIAPVLAYPQFGLSHKFVLETDASTVGLGAILSQVQDDGMIHSIAYIYMLHELWTNKNKIMEFLIKLLTL